MKIALLIVDKVKQIVLTPETDEEKAILKIFGRPQKTSGEPPWPLENEAVIYDGEFYFRPCMGGWIKQTGGGESIIIQCKPKEE